MNWVGIAMISGQWRCTADNSIHAGLADEEDE